MTSLNEEALKAAVLLALDLLENDPGTPEHITAASALRSAYLEAAKVEPTPSDDGLRGKVIEALGKPEDWAEKHAALLEWTGSAWLAGESDEPDLRPELYSFLCGLLGWVTAAETAAETALAAKPSQATPPVDALVEAARSHWHGVLLDGRNEHGSHVLMLPQRSVEMEQDESGNFLKAEAEMILRDAEALGFSTGSAVVALFDLCTDEGFFSHYEYAGVSGALTALLYGDAVEQVATAKAADAKRAEEPGDDPLKLEWRNGVPTKPWAGEWFIAETTYGDRVVLTALPDEYTYDFKTADETYIRADKIKRWMQFPDSQYIAPESAEPVKAVPVSGEVVDALAKALCESDEMNWDAKDFTETGNGEDPEDQRDYWREKARVALAHPSPDALRDEVKAILREARKHVPSSLVDAIDAALSRPATRGDA